MPAYYKINHFVKGDRVYHISNSRVLMVVIDISVENNELTCRWLDKDGKVQIAVFIPGEMGKAKDLGPEANF